MATENQCKRAIKAFENKLSALKGVVGLGIVPQAEDAKSSLNALAIAVYVEKKLPREKLKPSDVVPKHLKVATKQGDVEVPTRVIEQGAVELE